MTRNPHLRYELTKAFAAMRAKYGAEWDAKWAKVAEDDLLQAWADELAVFGNRPEVFAWALAHLPERAPNPMQFKRLADQAPRHDPHAPAQALPVRGPTPQERAALAQVRDGIGSGRPSVDWAYRIVERYQRGEAVAFGTLRIAAEALEAQEKRRAAPPSSRPDAYGAHPSALLADDDESLLATGGDEEHAEHKRKPTTPAPVHPSAPALRQPDEENGLSREEIEQGVRDGTFCAPARRHHHPHP